MYHYLPMGHQRNSWGRWKSQGTISASLSRQSWAAKADDLYWSCVAYRAEWRWDQRAPGGLDRCGACGPEPLPGLRCPGPGNLCHRCLRPGCDKLFELEDRKNSWFTRHPWARSQLLTRRKKKPFTSLLRTRGSKGGMAGNTTSLYYLRHCQSDTGNHDELNRGLTAKGMADRALIQAYFQNIDLDAVWSSPLPACQACSSRWQRAGTWRCICTRTCASGKQWLDA